MGSDKRGGGGGQFGGPPHDLVFGAADVGDVCAGGQGGADEAEHFGKLADGGADHDQVGRRHGAGFAGEGGSADGGGGVVGGAVDGGAGLSGGDGRRTLPAHA